MIKACKTFSGIIIRLYPDVGIRLENGQEVEVRRTKDLNRVGQKVTVTYDYVRGKVKEVLLLKELAPSQPENLGEDYYA